MAPAQKTDQALPPGIQVSIHSRLLVLVWVVAWVTTVPLFHIHLPDISDRLATPGSVAHTVFSPDLPGEFSRFSNNQDHYTHLSKKVLNSPELGFTLSSASKDREAAQPSALSVSFCLLNRPSWPTSVLELPALPRQLLVFGASQSPRAPPSITSA